MNEKIYQMVAPNIQFSKIVIKGKSKIGKKANAIRLIGVLNQPFQMIPGKDFDLDTWIVNNIGQVIKVEVGRKGIGVGNESHPRDQPGGYEMSKNKSMVPFLRRCSFLLGRR